MGRPQIAGVLVLVTADSLMGTDIADTGPGVFADREVLGEDKIGDTGNHQCRPDDKGTDD